MWKDGKKHGKGVHECGDDKWIGTWKDGKMDGEMSFVRNDGRETKFLYKNGEIIQVWGDVTDFITEQKSKNKDKKSRWFLFFPNDVIDNGVFSDTSKRSKAFVDNLKERISSIPLKDGVSFKDRFSVEFYDNFENIELKNQDQLRMILTTCPRHQFIVLLDEQNKTATILDNGGMDEADKQNCLTYLKKLDINNNFTINYKQVKFDGRNSYDDCVNHSEVIMEKLCRYFENEKKEISVNISGSNIVDKLMSKSISVASNLMKKPVGNGVSIDISQLIKKRTGEGFVISENNKLQVNNNNTIKTFNIFNIE
jgi:hypothetical protein